MDVRSEECPVYDDPQDRDDHCFAHDFCTQAAFGKQGYGVAEFFKDTECIICRRIFPDACGVADAICILTAYKRDAAALAQKKPSGPIGEEESAF